MAAVLISGANRGIGLELTQQFHARGDRVIAVSRTAADELAGLTGVRAIAGIDVTDEAAVTKLAQQMANQALDIVIHAAGILETDDFRHLDPTAIRRQFDTNALAPLRLTHALLPNLRNGSKVVLITSRMGSIGDNSSGGMYGYRMSKAALNAAGKSLAIDLQPVGIAVGILHPGMVATRMTGFSGIDPAESARNLIARIDALTLANSGEFLHAEGYPLPW
ncbi:MAG: SDR family oxidoreductase [Spongiibacteraceae bacterium]|jgi:NAD(P)-dependent dehydrogenase (short-subunit alcohol dehydrogenase family)|nr:SDR family oxidoreductase [Spongiibacteraceae bacterium]